MIFDVLHIENIVFWRSMDRKFWFLVLRGQKTLLFDAPRTENLFFGAPGTKILIFSDPGTENIDFW